MRRSSLFLAAALAPLLALSSPAHAGQVRVLVGSGGLQFVPSSVTVNLGDHVIFFWSASGHTSTSGNPTTQATDGKFASGPVTLAAGSRFFWKSDALGTETYFCIPHAPGMAGAISVVATGAAVADFRITEVEYAGSGGADRVQVSNLGDAAGQFEAWRFSSQAGVTQTLSTTALTVNANSTLTIHLNASGTNTTTDVFFPAAPELGTSGSFAIYVPNNTTGSTTPVSLTDAKQIIDYVAWGTPGQATPPNEATAVSAGFWSAGDAVPTDAALPAGGTGYSISFCGARTDHGSSFWHISRPNFGASPDCSTPALNPTWGRLKALYR